MNWVQMSRSERFFLSGTRERSTEDDHCYEDILRLLEVGAAGFDGKTSNWAGLGNANVKE